jgi:phosphoserine phosphatase RsbU/P
MTPEKSPLAQLRHDLRTPINHILGYGELLAEDLADQGVTNLADLEKITGAARELLHLVGTRLTDEGLSGIALQETVVRTGFHTVETRLQTPPAPDQDTADLVTGHILVVDDLAANRDVLVKRLERQGHRTSQSVHGLHALELLAQENFDLILLDVMMPEMDGFTALTRIKSDPALRHIPVIMISALDELENVVRCIEAGAEDFLPKPFNATLLRARIGASLEKKALRDQEQAHLRQIEETQNRLAAELAEAGRYVTSILPPPMDSPFRIRWAYDPSTELGGDSFGYHWIDDTHFAIYLLDVCGHGVGASLLSVAAINVIRSSALPETNFLEPAEVLAGLNELFQMERHNNMYFTIWYGVYDTTTRTLRHGSGGHPPAILLEPDGTSRELLASGMLIGGMPGMAYRSDTAVIPPGSRLCVYCDGAYEIKRPDGSMIGFEEDFLPFLRSNGRNPNLPDDVLTWVRSIHQEAALDDDYSFIALDFLPLSTAPFD